MKKHVVSLFAVVVSFSAYGACKLDNVSITTQEIIAISNIVSESSAVMECRTKILDFYAQSKSNEPLAAQKGGLSYCWINCLQTDWTPWKPLDANKYSDVELKEIDSAFGSAGVRSFNVILPICFTNAVLARFPNDVKRQSISFKYGKVCWHLYDGGEFYAKTKFTIDELAYMFKTDVCSVNELTLFYWWQNRMIDSYLVAVKQYRRKNGLSIVVKDGVNPLSSYMNKLTNALNAPMLNGINECFSDIGRNDLTVDFSAFPSVSEIATIKNKVMNDEADLNNALIKFHLRIGLGADGYNELVRWYNGGN